MSDSKHCLNCSQEFHKKYGYSKNYWAKAKFCSHSCSTRVSNFKGKTQTQEARDKMSEIKLKLFSVKENHPKWIHDRSKVKIYYNKKQDSLYKQWSLEVKKLDEWGCRIADKNCKGKLESHHILNWVEYPELRYNLNNGITLCFFHHPRKRAEEKRLSPYFTELVTNRSIGE